MLGKNWGWRWVPKKRGDGIMINYSYCRGTLFVFRLYDFSGVLVHCNFLYYDHYCGLHYGGFQKKKRKEREKDKEEKETKPKNKTK